MLRPRTVLDLLGGFTVWAAGRGRRIKIVARRQQVEAVNRIVERVVAGRSKKGLIWHFQGSGKSLLMLFAARRLRLHPKLGNPTVVIVVDRVDLDTQISATFHAADAPNLDKIIVTTIFKFGEADGVPILVERVVADVDEIVRHVRFEGWQSTHAGEREVKQALRKTLFKYKLHQDGELFDRAYGYVRQYY